MAIERVDSLYNMPAIEAEHEKLKLILSQDADAIISLYNNIEKFQNKSNVATGAGNWEKVSASIENAANTSEQLISIQKQLNDQLAKSAQLEKQLTEATDKLRYARKNNSSATDEERAASKIAGDETRQRVKDIIAQTDAYKKLENEYNKLAVIAKTKQAQAAESGNPEDKAAADQASAEAKKLSDRLKQIDDTVGQSSRKVGSYTDALKILEGELAKVNEQLANLKGGASNPLFPKLAKESETLTVLVNQQKKGFQSSTKEIQNASKALITMAQAGLQGTDAFKQLQKSLAENTREQQEFNEKQKILRDNLPVVKALSVAAKGLAGTYAIGAGAAALFSDSQEDVQKHLEKLVAIMTILQGLQEAFELVEKAGTIASILGADAIKTVVAGNIANAQTSLAAATAKKNLARAEWEAAVGADAEAAGMEATLAATEAETVAQAELATAIETTNAAWASIGIGAVVALAAAAIVYLVIKMKDWAAETKLSIEQQKALNDTLGEEAEALQKIADLQDELAKRDLNKLEEQVALEERSGQNQYKILAAKQAIADKNVELADSKYILALTRAEDTYYKQGLSGANALHAAQSKYFEDLTNSTYKVGVVEAEISRLQSMTDADRRAAPHFDRDLESAQKRLEAAKSEESSAKKNYDFYNNAEIDRTKAYNEQYNLRVDKAKMAEDELRKLTLETVNIETEARKRINEEVLNDQASTLEQRLKAISSNARQDLRKASAEFENIKSNPASTDTEVKIARMKLADDMNRIELEEAQKSKEIKYQYYVRDREAQVEIFNAEKQDRINQAQAILSETKSTFNERTKAQSDIYEAERAIRGAQFLKELDEKGLTDKERLKIAKQYETDLTKLGIEYGKTREDEVKKEHDRIIKEWENFYDKRKSLITQQEADQVIALNSKLTSGQITPADYDRQRAEINFKTQKDQLAAQIDADKLVVESYKEGTVERANAEEKLAQDRMSLSDLIANHEKDNIQKVRDLREEAAQEAEKTIVSFIDASFENELNNIQTLIDKNNKYKEQTTNRIAQSTLDEKEKAAAIQVINAQTQNQNEALQRRQRDIKVRQAKFDRDVAVAETIEQGAIAAIAALKIPIYGQAEAIAIGIITSLKVAEILARPLPTYGFGTEDHPGGEAIVGDRFSRELLLEPGKPAKWSPAVPTIMNLAKHSKVIPSEEIDRLAAQNMFVDQNGVLIVKEVDSSKRIERAIHDQTDGIVSALNKQRKTMTVNNRIDTRYVTHIESSVYKWNK